MSNSEETTTTILSEHNEQFVEWEPSKEDRQVLAELNQDTRRLAYHPNRHGGRSLTSWQFVGSVGFPSGRTVIIEPKAAGANFPYLLQMSDMCGKSLPYPTTISTGDKFFEPIAELYTTTVAQLLDPPHRLYHETESKHSNHGTRLDVTAAIQNIAGDYSKPPYIEDYDEYDIDTNRLLLTALVFLKNRYDIQPELANQVNNLIFKLQNLGVDSVPDAQAESLAADVDNLLRGVSASEEKYEEAVKIAAHIVSGEFIDTLVGSGATGSSYLINMDDVFERTVERVFRRALSKTDYQVSAQTMHTSLTPSPPFIESQPDILVENEEEVPVLVADTKWTKDVSRSEINQAITYSVAFDSSTALIYPEAGDKMTETYSLRNGHPLYIVEAPVATECSSFDEWQKNHDSRD